MTQVRGDDVQPPSASATAARTVSFGSPARDRIFSHSGPSHRRENAFTASYRAEWAHFQAAIAGDAKVPALKEHLTLHQVIDGIYRSAFDRRDVEL